ncbi:hypothetical protein [Mucilaginibacter sp.]|uniref:hypothetical protein n=1 Tax=Mucilaginibacter sp. TaxID=1882438 RepID=UPI002600DB60|nr:hypothetical protein [Mucilaginibacter sp.]
MEIGDVSFHDAKILEAKELVGRQIMEFLIDFPVDWENNIFEHRILRFDWVTHYAVNEIPFEGNPTILEVNESVSERGANRVEFATNAGNRVIDYLNCELVNPNEATTNL